MLQACKTVSSTSKSFGQDALWIGIIAVAYFLAFQIAFIFPALSQILATYWPAAGIGLAALLLCPRRLWPAVISTLFVVGVTANLMSGRPFIVSLGFMIANALESLGCAWLIIRICGDEVRFTRIREIATLIGCAVLLNACTALIGAGTAAVVTSSPFGDFWKSWWITDGLGILLITPFLVIWFRGDDRPPIHSLGGILEQAVFMSVWLLVSWCVFYPQHSYFQIFPHFHAYIPIALLVWPATRLGLRTVSLSLITLSIIAITSLSMGDGSSFLHEMSTEDRLLEMQVFTMCITMTGYLLTISQSEIRFAERSTKERNDLLCNAATALQEKEQRLALATNAAQLGIWDWDVENNRMTWDERMYQLYGVDASTPATGVEIWQNSLHPDDAIASWETCQAALRGEKPWDTEFRIRLADGTVRHIKANGLVIRNENGKPIRMLGINYDITERKLAEAALLKSENEYRSTVMHLHVGVVVHRHDTSILFSNPTAQRLLGLTEAQMLGKSAIDPVWCFVHEDLSTMALDDYPVRKVLATKKPLLNYTIGINRPDKGHPTWVTVNAIPIFSDPETVEKVVINFVDFTDLKLADTALRDSQQRLSLATRSSGIGVWDWDIVKNNMTWDEQMYRLYGVDAATSATGVEIWKNGLHPDDAAATWETCQAALRGEKPWDTEFRIHHPNGTIRHIKANGMVIRDETGKPLRMLGVNVDITERKCAEEEGNRLSRLLHQREKLDAIGQLASGIAHDFNNQLAVIMGYGELLKAQSDDPALQQKIGIIISAAQRSKDLTRQLLSYARRAALRQEHIDLHALLQETAEMLRRSIDKRIDIVLECAATRDPDGDSSQLQNALMNLFINARDAMPQGGILSIATADRCLDSQERLQYGLESGNDDWVELVISDTGVGMAPEVLARIFDPFFTTKGPNKGTGLGLAMVHGTIHQMGGTISVESHTGHGCTFRILLPAGHLGEMATSAPTALATRRLRLLIIDDETDVRGALCAQLESRGHAVTVMADGPSAIAWYQDHRATVDLVLLDLNMPQMNGVDVLKALKALDAEARVAIVTGNAEMAISAGVMSLGAVTVLEKPLPHATLAELERYARPPVKVVLMIDDEEEYREIVGHHFRKNGYDLVGVDSAAKALTVLAAQPIHALLIDQKIPGTDGPQILREIRTAGHAMPAIMVSGDIHSVDRERLQHLGVVQFYEKSCDIKPLILMIEQMGAS